jgi:hypothetical protein
MLDPFRFKAIIIFLTLLYMISIEISSGSTKNWDHSRRLGYAQKGKCNDPSLRYTIDDVSPYGDENQTDATSLMDQL